jgi:hypothetical protein
VWNPHHPRIFLHEDDDDDAPPRGDTSGRAASGDTGSAPLGENSAWPPTRTTARNTAGPDNIDDKRGRKRRNSGNARKEAGRWPQPPHWQATGGRGKKRVERAASPVHSGLAELALKVRSCLLRTFTCFYPNINKMTTAAGNTSGRGSTSFYGKYRVGRQRIK